MKKVLSVMLIAIMAMFALTGCGGSGNGGGGGAEPEPVSVDSLKTMGDIIALDSSEQQVAVYGGVVVYAFKLGDNYYRAISKISEEVEQAYNDVDILADDHEEKQNEILGPIAIDTMENLSEQILSQEELDALVGKTGQELQDAGWVYSGHDLEKMEFWMEYGPFSYAVTFDGSVAEADYEDFEDEAGTKDLVVKAARFNDMMGDATNIEIPE